ncbi:MAG TPA: thioredoxin family protein [Phycisphaerales bacterium]|nr:thioredoxin family protein [Phycisphaerales bacterium]
MAQTPSTMRLELGTDMPEFDLPNYNRAVNGDRCTHVDCAGPRGTLVMFICNHCPFVVHVADELARLGHDASSHGIGVVAIMSNDVKSHPDDAPERMAEEAERRGYTFPYLFDETQEVAKAFHASCTPDFFLFDANGKLVYRGQLDDSRPGSDVPVTGRDLRQAMHAVAEGQQVTGEQHPSIGCNIKWIPGNEPDYFG